MNGQSEAEQAQNFQERLSQWISSQGFWFQLRYSLSGGSWKGVFVFYFLRLFSRVAIFLTIIIVVSLVVIVKQTDGKGYRNKVRDSIQEKLGGAEIELAGFSVGHGEFRISSLGIEGGGETFFNGLNLRNLRCRMGLFDRFKPEWNIGVLEISSLEMEVCAGADSEESAAIISDVVFQNMGRMKMEKIQVADMSMVWGYSERTRGSIFGSAMSAKKVDDSWILSFRGGQFSQNWLRDLDIVELDIKVTKDKLIFEKASFTTGETGKINFDGLIVETGDRPMLDGNLSLEKVDLDPFLPLAVHDYVEGVISAELKVFGSTNSSGGVGYEGKVELGEHGSIILRDKIHVLRALSVVDSLKSYRRMDFRIGSFDLKSHAGKVELSDLFLITADLFTLEGGLQIRIPTSEEATAFNEFLAKNDSVKDLVNDKNVNERYNLTLERAAEISKNGKEIGFGTVGNLSLFDRLGLSREDRRREQKAAEIRFSSFQYEGGFTISLDNNSFQRAPKLAELYKPEKGAEGRIKLRIPVEGTLFEVTQKQAEEIYQMGTR